MSYLRPDSIPDRVLTALADGGRWMVADVAEAADCEQQEAAKALRGLQRRGWARRVDGLPRIPGRGQKSIWRAA